MDTLHTQPPMENSRVADGVPGPPVSGPNSYYDPQHMKQNVVLRDGGRVEHVTQVDTKDPDGLLGSCRNFAVPRCRVPHHQTSNCF